MKEKTTGLLNTVCHPMWFTIAVLLYLPINMIAVVNILPFTRVALALFCVWGALVMAKIYLFSGKQPYTRSILVLIAFLVVCFGTEVLNYRYGGFDQIEKLYFTAIGLLILFAQFGLTAEERRRELYVISHAIPVITTLALLASIWMYLAIYVANITVRSGVTIRVGFAENRLIGVFTSANVGGTYAIISLILCAVAYLLRKRDGKLSRWFCICYGIQAFISLVFISLTLSKGTYVNSAFVIVFAGLIFPTKRFNWLTLLKKVLCIGIVCGIFFAGTSLLRRGMAWSMLQINARLISGIEDPDAPDDMLDKYEIVKRAQLGWDGRVEAGREDIDFTNKRSGIWLGTLRLLKGKQLLTGVNNSVNYLEQNESTLHLSADDAAFIRWSTSNTHNGYLQVLMQCGIVALLLIFGFLVVRMLSHLITLMRQLAQHPAEPVRRVELAMCVILFTFVLMILENNMYESNFVLMGTNYFQAMFWYILGLCGYTLEQLRKGESLW